MKTMKTKKKKTKKTTKKTAAKKEGTYWTTTLRVRLLDGKNANKAIQKIYVMASGGVLLEIQDPTWSKVKEGE
jgi:hypothetical protein